MIGDIESRDELIDRAARALGALPPASPAATARIMAAVRAQQAQRPSMWRRAWTSGRDWMDGSSLSMRGAALLAAASLLIGFVVRGEVPPAPVLDAVTAPAIPVVPANANALEPSTVAVPLVFESRTARAVSVVGDFNGWDPSATPMQRFGADGPWTVTIAARPGRHTYAFLVDGATLVADPRAPHARSVDYGGDASVMMVRMP